MPSGDQMGDVSRSGLVEIFVRLPPATGTVQTSLLRPSSSSSPVRLETNAMRYPSGDHCGSVSFHASPFVIWRAAPDDASMTQRCVRLSSYQPVSLNL